MESAAASSSYTRDVIPHRLACIVSRFPALTETFVLYEILEMERLGIEVELYPLLRERQAVVQPEAMRLIHTANFRPYFGLRVWQDNWHYLFRRPRSYLTALVRVLRGTWGSTKFFAGAIIFFPRAVSFARAMERAKISHVHAHFANHPALVAFVIYKLTKIPFSFTARGSDIHVDRTMLPEKLSAAVLVVAVSTSNKEVMTNGGDAVLRDKVHVIYGGVDTELFAPPAQHSAPDGLRIICVARFEAVKGHGQLVAACGLLHERGVEFTCHLVGDGELRPHVERQIARLGLQGRITVHGNRTRQEVASALKRATVFALATAATASGKREGLPNVLKEAMACGLPVVASRISGIPELVEDGVSGLLVPASDSAALAGALLRLGRDPALRQRMGRAGRARIESEFDLRATTRRRAALFFGSVNTPHTRAAKVQNQPHRVCQKAFRTEAK